MLSSDVEEEAVAVDDADGRDERTGRGGSAAATSSELIRACWLAGWRDGEEGELAAGCVWVRTRRRQMGEGAASSGWPLQELELDDCRTVPCACRPLTTITRTSSSLAKQHGLLLVVVDRRPPRRPARRLHPVAVIRASPTASPPSPRRRPSTDADRPPLRASFSSPARGPGVPTVGPHPAERDLLGARRALDPRPRGCARPGRDGRVGRLVLGRQGRCVRIQRLARLLSRALLEPQQGTTG